MDKVEGVREGVRERVSGAKQTVGDAAPSTEDVKGTARQAVSIAESNPLGLAVGGLAAGFLAGLLLPTTTLEERKLAPKAEELKERARETATEAVERGKQVAEQVTTNVAETAKQTAKETIQHGASGGSSGQS